jgi:hypothetical protein
LALGASMRGGEEKVGEVSVGVKQFANGVAGLRDGVVQRKKEMKRLVKEREMLVGEKGKGWDMLRVAERVGVLEDAVNSLGNEDDADDFDDEDAENDVVERGLARLRRLVFTYRATKEEVFRLGGDAQPFMKTLLSRLAAARKILLLDLATALKQAKSDKNAGGVVVKILGLYSTMDETGEAVLVLKN